MSKHFQGGKEEIGLPTSTSMLTQDKIFVTAAYVDVDSEFPFLTFSFAYDADVDVDVDALQGFLQYYGLQLSPTSMSTSTSTLDQVLTYSSHSNAA